MCRIAAVVGCFALACFALAFRLYVATNTFASGPDYDRSTAAVIGDVEADGSAIFFPVVLLAGIGFSLVWFAVRLWRNRQIFHK